MGFQDVCDYVPGKVAWFAAGRPSEGSKGDTDRAGTLARDVATCAVDDTIGGVAGLFRDTDPIVVVTRDDVVVGLLRPEAVGLPDATLVSAAMQPGPSTVRPSIVAAELAQSMVDDHEDRVLVTTFTGHLVGLIRRDDLDGRS